VRVFKRTRMLCQYLHHSFISNSARYIYIRPGEFFVFFVRDVNKIGLDRPSRPTVLVGKFSSVDHQMRGRIMNRGRSCVEQVPRARRPVFRWTHSSVASGTSMANPWKRTPRPSTSERLRCALVRCPSLPLWCWFP
jgi:hypothetical protein